MIKQLTKVKPTIYHIVNGQRVEGVHSGIWGDVSGISGNVWGISGDASGISGNVSGIRGDVSGIWGNLDECELTDEEREQGVQIEDLLQ